MVVRTWLPLHDGVLQCPGHSLRLRSRSECAQHNFSATLSMNACLTCPLFKVSSLAVPLAMSPLRGMIALLSIAIMLLHVASSKVTH